MMKMIFFSTALMLIVCNLQEIFADCSGDFSLNTAIFENSRSQSTVFRTHTNINTWLSCSRLCLLRSLCKSFNYNKDTLVCEISSNYGIFTVPGPSPSWFYGDATKFPQEMLGSCAYHVCFDHQICVPRTLDGHSCLDVDECTPSQSLANMNYHIVDGTLKLSCRGTMIGSGNDVAYCSYDSSTAVFSWSINYACTSTSDCYVMAGNVAVYTGTLAQATDGKICDNWDETTFSETYLATLNVSLSENFCRDVEKNGNIVCPDKKIGNNFDLNPCSVTQC